MIRARVLFFTLGKMLTVFHSLFYHRKKCSEEEDIDRVGGDEMARMSWQMGGVARMQQRAIAPWRGQCPCSVDRRCGTVLAATRLRSDHRSWESQRDGGLGDRGVVRLRGHR